MKSMTLIHLSYHFFTGNAKSGFDKCIYQVDGVVDAIGIDTLFEPNKPSQNTVYELPKWINDRGTESRLEKAHHSLEHFENGGMKFLLVDVLNLASISLNNLSMQYHC